MHKVSLSNRHLDKLVETDSTLQEKYYGTIPCDKLPEKPEKYKSTAYIVNTQPEGMPGEHWIAIWTYNGVCEVFDSYSIPLDLYPTAKPIVEWLKKWQFVMRNGKALQATNSQSCGDYAFFFLLSRSRGKQMTDFLNEFSSKDYLQNDLKISKHLRRYIEKVREWKECGDCFEQATNLPRGVGELLSIA